MTELNRTQLLAIDIDPYTNVYVDILQKLYYLGERNYSFEHLSKDEIDFIEYLLGNINIEELLYEKESIKVSFLGDSYLNKL